MTEPVDNEDRRPDLPPPARGLGAALWAAFLAACLALVPVIYLLSASVPPPDDPREFYSLMFIILWVTAAAASILTAWLTGQLSNRRTLEDERPGKK